MSGVSQGIRPPVAGTDGLSPFDAVIYYKWNPVTGQEYVCLFL